jgi:GGDEF domain-containing protein
MLLEQKSNRNRRGESYEPGKLNLSHHNQYNQADFRGSEWYLGEILNILREGIRESQLKDLKLAKELDLTPGLFKQLNSLKLDNNVYKMILDFIKKLSSEDKKSLEHLINKANVCMNSGEDVLADLTTLPNTNSENNMGFGIIIGALIQQRENIYESREGLKHLVNHEYYKSQVKKIIKDLILSPNFIEESKKHALVMLDLNALKGINDVFGMKKGDEMLKAFAELLNSEEFSDALQGVGVEVKLKSARSGDEFDLLLYCKDGFDKEKSENVKNVIKEKIQNIPSIINENEIINNNKLRENSKLSAERIQELSKCQFVITSSIGLVRPDRAFRLDNKDLLENSANPIDEYRALTFFSAELEAKKSKREIKEEVSKGNTLMKYLLSFREETLIDFKILNRFLVNKDSLPEVINEGTISKDATIAKIQEVKNFLFEKGVDISSNYINEMTIEGVAKHRNPIEVVLNTISYLTHIQEFLSKKELSHV